MHPHYRLRLYLLTALIVFGVGALLTRLYSFQIERRDEFLKKVPGSHTVTVREPGIRGEITDRNGIVLAENLRNYEVTFNLDEIFKAYVQQFEDTPKVDRLSKEGGLTRRKTKKDIVEIVNNWIIKRLNEKDLNLARNYKARALEVHYDTHGGLVPFSYRADLTYEEFARFAEHNLELPGVYIGTVPQRHYPYDALASHVIGHVKPWNKADIPASAARKFNHYIGDEKGYEGVEASMDETLRGLEGVRTILKDDKGRVIRPIDITHPEIGAKLTLTIDAPVQYLLENTLRLAGRAAGIVMDVNSGEVLAMASVPDYNPNDFIPSISQENWDSYREIGKLGPFTNRAISRFAPGSTMKIPTAIAGALEGMASRRFTCNGYVTYGKARVGCWIWNKSKGSHGSQTLPEAIQHSCNPYFNTLANSIGHQAMVTGCSMVGIGDRTGIELPAEDPGILAGSRAWRAMFPNRRMTSHETALLSMGQGTSMATPLQMCAVAACVANGGKYFQPRVVKEAVAADGKVLIADTPKLKVDLIQAGIKPADFELIRKGMLMSANDPGGTSGKVKLKDVKIAAKSGTAQTSDNGKPSLNSWIISFAPYENPKYAVCIMVQNGKSGGAVAGPLVNLVYRGLFARDNHGIRLPLKPQQRAKGYIGDPVDAIEVSPELIASVEAGDTTPSPEAIAEAAADTPADAEDLGETGDEAGTAPADLLPSTPIVMPEPVITPEADAAGTIPRAIPVRENN